MNETNDRIVNQAIHVGQNRKKKIARIRNSRLIYIYLLTRWKISVNWKEASDFRLCATYRSNSDKIVKSQSRHIAVCNIIHQMHFPFQNIIQMNNLIGKSHSISGEKKKRPRHTRAQASDIPLEHYIMVERFSSMAPDFIISFVSIIVIRAIPKFHPFYITHSC